MNTLSLTTSQNHAQTQAPPLEVRDVTINLCKRTVLHDVSFTIAPGSFVGLVGPNGAGKTTLMRAILRLITRCSGTISISGISNKKGIRHLGYVPQRHEFAWDFPINVHDTVLSGLTSQIGLFHRTTVEHYKAVLEALELVKLADLSQRPIAELSGGQRQRVLVARALVTNPDILLLDEPFTGLDMPSQEILLELFQYLASNNKALLMSTHDLHSAMNTCSSLILLNQTVIAQGKPQELSDPKLWMNTFNISQNSPLLHTIGLQS
ncbi:MAG: anchored repeat-type ABC transporter ATP-binding subunit [Bifidobacteriaceae bacterium]|nr:anchored repeat-type ABC transporter ATP-binding subunit [Bifidobacteriaceae bacterium]